MGKTICNYVFFFKQRNYIIKGVTTVWLVDLRLVTKKKIYGPETMFLEYLTIEFDFVNNNAILCLESFRLFHLS